MSNPFPAPKHFQCPYCDEAKAWAGKGDLIAGKIHFSHRLKERVRIGRVTYADLETIHQFVIIWTGEAWKSATTGLGSSQMCEKVEFNTGDNSGWRGYDQEDLA